MRLTGPFAGVAWAATSLTVVFLAVPLVAIFAELGLRELVDGVTSPQAVDALRVTAVTSFVGIVVIVGVGTPTAYLLATGRFPGRAALVTLLELPLVLPPAVAGIGLLAAFSPLGLLGGTVEALGLEIAFTKVAVVLAVIFVSSPFYLRPAMAAFAAVEPSLLAASRTLGAGPFRTFARVALPLAAGGLGTGAALAFARGVGEFGATILFAGSLQGVTQTLSLAIYEQLDVDPDVALAIAAELILVSALILVGAKVVARWKRSTSRSRIRFAPSRSS